MKERVKERVDERVNETASGAGLDFLVSRDDWSDTRFDEAPVPDVASGEVLFRVDRFAFTANNISYAKAGDMLRYWDFFPAREGLGRIPVMGFGDVVVSRCPQVPEGQRVFGFFPMSRYLTIQPANVSAAGITDGAAHREGIAPAYNTYSPIDADPRYAPEHEDAHMLMRGLFLTSFLVDDFVAEHGRFGSSQVVITSASSKTSIALAWLVHRAGRSAAIGLTSPRNAAFVKSLGYYDDVILYDDIESIAEEPTVAVDMAGSGSVTNRLHHHLGDQMKYSCSVGATHFDATQREKDLPGATPEFFFAPGQIQKRAKEWGAEKLNERIGDAWASFRDDAAWLEVVRGSGREAVLKVYRETLEGRTAPHQGHVISLWEE